MITRGDFSIEEVVRGMKKPEIGAIVTFLGIVRDEDGTIEGMEVEAYKEMAEEELRRLKEEVMEKFDIEDVVVIHREGLLSVSDNIVIIAVGARHRKDAFRACEYMIDELKKRVPIWKKEIKS
ncbi:MAG: molybdenum cofactor biosynthesis protein MoaE [Candidatus Methanospirareceae archaeon]